MQHIHVCNVNGADSGNANNDDNPIVSSSSFSYLGRITKRTKDDIVQHCVVCVKNKRDPKGSRERSIHHDNKTKALSKTSGTPNYFVPNNLEGGSESTKYTDMQSEYIVNLAKIKLLEARIMAYYMRDPFIIPTLVYEYASAVEYRWGNRAVMGIYLLSH